jgi:hypothetical protein
MARAFLLESRRIVLARARRASCGLGRRYFYSNSSLKWWRGRRSWGSHRVVRRVGPGSVLCVLNWALVGIAGVEIGIRPRRDKAGLSYYHHNYIMKCCPDASCCLCAPSLMLRYGYLCSPLVLSPTPYSILYRRNKPRHLGKVLFPANFAPTPFAGSPAFPGPFFIKSASPKSFQAASFDFCVAR